MTVHVLVVEDDDDFVEEIREIVAGLPGGAEIRLARSRDEAYVALNGGFLDLVILDLKIPTVTRALDADPKHGYAVFSRIRSVAPGTSIFVLTGSPVEDFVPDLLRNQQQIDIWSEGKKVGNIDFLPKYKINECPAKLEPIAAAIERLSDVEIERDQLTLQIAEDRLIRIFAKKFRGARCVVSHLGGGLSGARVVRLKVTDSQGVLMHDAVAKLGPFEEVRSEGERFDEHVGRLAPAATPRKLAILEFGAHSLAGIFFGLADGFDESAFEVARKSSDRSITLIRNVAQATAKWVDGVPQTRRTIKTIRQRVLSDAGLDAIASKYALGWVNEFESRSIQTRWACIHGDLHGCNVLVAPDGASTLIDYGDVGEGSASLDPITLEFSLLFHPDGPRVSTDWPTLAQARSWGDLDAYLAGCPFPEFVRECRCWALGVAAGKRDVAASAYAYLVRQLKYEDTNKELALALLEGVRAFYSTST